MLKTEFCKPITVEELEALHEKLGLVVEINDGEVVSADFEAVRDGCQ